MKPLSKRSLEYLSLIATTEAGYFGIIPWTTQCLLVREGLIVEGDRRYGIYTLRVTDKGRTALRGDDAN